MFRPLFICLVLFQLVLGHMMQDGFQAGLPERDDVRERVWSQSLEGQPGEPDPISELAIFRSAALSGPGGGLRGVLPGFEPPPVRTGHANSAPRGPPLRA